MTDEFDVRTGAAVVTAITYAAKGARAACILGHGAGADQRSGFMVSAARGLAARGIETSTFNFPYTQARKRVPDRAPVLEACWRDVIAAVRSRGDAARPLFLGGKSMGGRMASHVAAVWDADRDGRLDGLVFFGYPLHPPGKPTQLRAAHLAQIRVPMLFMQGSRDTFGTPAEIEQAAPLLPFRSRIHEVAGGDHSLMTSKGRRAGLPTALAPLLDEVVAWMRAVVEPER